MTRSGANGMKRRTREEQVGEGVIARGKESTRPFSSANTKAAARVFLHEQCNVPGMFAWCILQVNARTRLLEGRGLLLLLLVTPAAAASIGMDNNIHINSGLRSAYTILFISCVTLWCYIYRQVIESIFCRWMMYSYDMIPRTYSNTRRLHIYVFRLNHSRPHLLHTACLPSTEW